MIQVSEYIWRGPRPVSKQWLKDLGFQTVINLESGTFEALHDDTYEGENDETGFSEIGIQLSWLFPPDRNVLVLLAYFLSNLEEHNVKTYVHCLAGKDRTGMVIAAHRILNENWPIKKAIFEMKYFGFHTWIYWFWIPTLRRLT